MFRKIHCDWFLSDGIFAPVRLDAPMFIEDALVSAGRIRADLTNEEHMAVEWIYRREWRYRTEFSLDAAAERTFLRLSGLKGSWRALINGAEAARGKSSSAVFEISANLAARNLLEVCFDADTSGEMQPVTGFSGMLSARQTGPAAITKLNITEDGRLFAALDMLSEGEAELSLRIRNSGGAHESKDVQTYSFGYTPLVFDEMSAYLQPGEINDVALEARCGEKVSDSCSLSVFISDERVQPRGFVASSEELISLAESAGALSAFTPDAEPDFSHRLLCARHGLESLSSDGLPVYLPEAAAQPIDRLIAIAGSEEQLDKDEVWLLAGSDRKILDSLRDEVPSGELEKLISLSRYRQAIRLREDALEARLSDRCFVVDAVAAKPAAPASSALSDYASHMRPAYYALMGAWQSEVGYVKLVGGAQDIITCEVYYVCDSALPHADAISVCVYGMDGVKSLSNSFPAMAQGCVGRFTFELPEGGAAVVRTSLVKGEESTMSTDEVILGEGVHFEDLPLTQLLAADGKMTNVGSAAALGVCVPGAGYFGCLLPGEYVNATHDDPDEAEGLNIFI